MVRRRLTATERELIDQIATRLASYKPTDIRHESVDEAARLAAATLRNKNSLDDLVGPTCTTTSIAKWWNISRQAVHKAAIQNRIVGIQDAKHTWHFPTWQLKDDHTLIAGIPETLEVLKKLSQTDRAAWYIQPYSSLNGLTPAQWLIENHKLEPLLEEAKKYSYSQQRKIRQKRLS